MQYGAPVLRLPQPGAAPPAVGNIKVSCVLRLNRSHWGHGKARHKQRQQCRSSPEGGEEQSPASTSGSTKRDSFLGEEFLVRLRAAEEEAEALRKELAAVKSDSKGQQAPKTIENGIGAPAKRVDGTETRVTPFGSKSSQSWLSEADVEFFTGGGPSEEGKVSGTDSLGTGATIQRRLVTGLAASFAFVLLSVVPFQIFQFKPSRPLLFYLLSLVRVQELVSDCKDIIERADWEQLRAALARIQGPPNNVRQSLDNALAFLEDGKRMEKGRRLASELMEYLDAMDYNKYFDAKSLVKGGGAQQQQYVAFSLKAQAAALQRLQDILALMPSNDLEVARTQLVDLQ